MKRKLNFKLDGETLTYNMMMFPAIGFLIIFCIIPLFGVIIAFQNYIPAKGILRSEWVGLENFKFMFQIPDSMQVFSNTIIIATLKIVFSIIVPVAFALLLNEVRQAVFKKIVQTVVVMPYFLSWVILGTIFVSMLSTDGVVNSFIGLFGVEPIMFLGSNKWFRTVLVITDTWKNFGHGAIIYISALLSIDPCLYEASSMDGASRWQNITRITLPLLVPTILLMTTLKLGRVLNAGFEQVFTLYNPTVYATGDIIDTYVYRMGLVQLQYSLSTAVGLMKSATSFILIIASNYLAKRLSGYNMF